MGSAKGSPLVLTPDLTAWRVVLEVFHYPRAEWGWLMDTGQMIHRLVHGIDKISWVRETGVPREHINPEDLY